MKDMFKTHGTDLVRRLRKKHKLAEKAPKRRRAEDGRPLPPSVEDRLEYLKAHRAYKAELKQEMRAATVERMKPFVEVELEKRRKAKEARDAASE
jgi:hypothetical protein